MTTRDYRDLLDLMLDGVVYRKNYAQRRDPDADYIYSELVVRLMRGLPEPEKAAMEEALYATLPSRTMMPMSTDEALERAR